jgi:predicted nucleic acid-binding protein
MMTYLLDTDTVSYIINKNSAILEKLDFHREQNDRICISSVTYYELLFGALKKQSQTLLSRIDAFAAIVSLVEFGADEALDAAKIRNALESRGTPTGQLDILIAAAAISYNATLVTGNTKHFENIPNLKIENWL